MEKSKSSVLTSLLLVFLSGALVGALGYRLYMVKTAAPSEPSSDVRRGGGRPSPEEVRRMLIKEMRERVKLDDRQVAQLNKIYDQTKEEFDRFNHSRNKEARALWDKQTDAIRAMLRPDQLPLFEKLHEEREMERRKFRKRMLPPPPPDAK